MGGADEGVILLLVGAVLAASIVVALGASHTGIPSLVAFLALVMLLGSAVRELGLPRDALVAVVVRGHDAIPPRGSTTVAVGDRLFVLAPRKMRADLEDVSTRWRRRVQLAATSRAA